LPCTAIGAACRSLRRRLEPDRIGSPVSLRSGGRVGYPLRGPGLACAGTASGLGLTAPVWRCLHHANLRPVLVAGTGTPRCSPFFWPKPLGISCSRGWRGNRAVSKRVGRARRLYSIPSLPVRPHSERRVISPVSLPDRRDLGRSARLAAAMPRGWENAGWSAGPSSRPDVAWLAGLHAGGRCCSLVHRYQAVRAAYRLGHQTEVGQLPGRAFTEGMRALPPRVARRWRCNGSRCTGTVVAGTVL